MTIHVVQPGETLSTIAAEYGLTSQRIAAINSLRIPGRLTVGQTLVIRMPAQTHTVAYGETVYSIARAYDIPVNQLFRNNPALRGQNLIYSGQSLVIRYAEEMPQQAITVNGYAYPTISRPLLRQTLPFLTHLTPFTYGFTPEGDLIPPQDADLIQTAFSYDVASLMHLSTLTADGNFNSELGHALLNSPDAQKRLLANILENMRIKGYTGLDIDFEYLPPEDAVPYAQFITQAAALLNPEGYEVIVALAPKTSPDQRGKPYEGHNYALLGAAANQVFLMTYEWGYTASPPMAVAPINRVREVLDFAVTQIPPAKILMGIPNYGYNWSMPFIQGESRAPSLSNEAAMELAVREQVPILFDETAQTPYFTYTDSEGVYHEVWFEDARSILAKLKLVREYDLVGVGYWNLDRPFPQNWQVLDATYQIQQTLG